MAYGEPDAIHPADYVLGNWPDTDGAASIYDSLVLRHQPLGPTPRALQRQAVEASMEAKRPPSRRERKRSHGPDPMKPRRVLVFERDRYACVVCGVRASKGARLTLDHIVPRSKGGTNDIANLQTMCWGCNNKKGDSLPKDTEGASAARLDG